MAREDMLTKHSEEGEKERCCCNEGGHCTCAYKKEPPVVYAPRIIPATNSTTSGESDGGRPRAEGTGSSLFDPDDTKHPQNRVSERDPAPDTLSTGTLDDTSRHYPSEMREGLPDGSWVGYASQAEQGGPRTGAVSAAMGNSHASTIQWHDNQLPSIEPFHPIYNNLYPFGETSEAEQHDVDTWQNAITGDWLSHDVSSIADFGQGQGFSAVDIYGSQQPLSTNAPAPIFAGTPLLEDATAGSFWHNTAL
ncbi:hypothetical protein NKR23_g12409 [Pleurostoma richardsiae]|uniref:Uncharacterized protein n=1 Tax=Pleurostoma richardsiae TaxID=41990 RepID=A0AA38R7L8_9PEZI|nr:hypothetical protein NKR23_g12409 [Pleurostoma richardsiae]